METTTNQAQAIGADHCIATPHGEDPFAVIANHLLCCEQAKLPDLSHVTLILPSITDSLRLHHHLLQQVHTALLGLQITTFRQFIDHHFPLQTPLLNNHARELMLVEVLQDSEALTGQGSPWSLADELLRLFDELQLGDAKNDTLNALATAFDNDQQHPGSQRLSAEATKVALLWQAWQIQLEEEAASDRVLHYSEGLNTITLPAESHVYIAGFDWLHAQELKFVLRYMERGQVTLFFQPDQPLTQQLQQAGVALPSGKTHPSDNGLSNALDWVFNTQTPLLQRIHQAQQQQHRKPEGIRIFCADTVEAEAQAIDIQVRRWLLEGHRNIAVVTQDRRLARRISALLRRANINAQDTAGWALSTTKAAGILERWLECLETGFDYLALLDVLKSGFLRQQSIEQETLYRFERDIIENEGVNAQLDHYREAIIRRAQALGEPQPSNMHPLLQLVDWIEHAAEPLQALPPHQNHPPATLINALRESLERLGLWEGFALDAAGQRIQQEFSDMLQGLQQRQINMHWNGFRTWLGRALETHNFRPARDPGGVQIIDFEQTTLGHYDALIIAAADQAQLPGTQSRQVFFNQAVRFELGLKTWEISRQQRFSQFRRLLQAAPQILISYTDESSQGVNLPSPWVAQLQQFCLHTHHDDLRETSLTHMIRNPLAQVASTFPAELPPPTTPPIATLPANLLPKTLSASGHQQLLRCPYQFFAARGLRLRAREYISEQLSKRDYGELIHQCLQAFHQQQPGLPPAFLQRINSSNRQAAIDALTTISHALFSSSLKSHFEHRAWWQLWENLIPGYIDWQMQRQQDWQLRDTELRRRKKLTGIDTHLIGTIDRVDKLGNEISLIDYKTGIAPGNADILSGEDVQLLSYALLIDHVVEISYLSIDPGKGIQLQSQLQGEDLTTLLPDIQNRLENLLNDIANGHPLPANADAQACQYCDMQGLCRRSMHIDLQKH